MKARIVSAFLLSLLMLCAPAFAQQGPDELVKNVTEEVLSIVRSDKDIQSGNAQKTNALIEQKVLPHFDFMHMTALALGRDWAKASPEQQKKLSSEFQALLVNTYSNALSTYKHQTINYKPFRMAANQTDALVRTEIRQPGGAPVQLDYRLEKQGNSWKVYDVIVGGISLVTNYRDTFAQEVRNAGIDGLIQSLAAKNKQIAAGRQK
ncbi:MAG: ABC transporter substrate-binding protein [Betaproteobacteria bacterium]|nr:ABC transporter substrate-binding protein [Betaproteobacteria bacterium]